MQPEGELETVQQCLDIMDKIIEENTDDNPLPFGIWFRGENNRLSDDFEHLRPSIFRKKEPPVKYKGSQVDYYDESGLYNLVPTRIDSLRQCSSDFERLSMMQHYDMPSRLLDWSENILVALYFAVSRQPELDSTLFVLNARKLNEITGMRQTRDNLHSENDFGTKFRCEFIYANQKSDWFNALNSNGYSDFLWDKTKYQRLTEGRNPDCEKDIYFNEKVLSGHATPVAVIPNRINQRMVTQNSVFTLHGGKCYSERLKKMIPPHERIPEPASLQDINRDSSENILTSYHIPSVVKPDLRKQLFSIGIHKSSLFLEIDRQGEYVKTLF